MRPDVQRFAEMMSAVMDEKAGECKPPDNFPKAMGQIQMQMRKFEENPYPTPEQARRILVHIANWSMIAERKLGGE